MLKKVLAATAVLAIAGSSFVYAQRADGPGGRDRGPDRRPGAERYQPTPEDISAFADARIAAIKAGLKLTPDQEKNWAAFESGYRNLAKLRTDRMAARREAWRQRREGGAQNRGEDRGEARDQTRDRDATGNMVERMQRRADAMTKSAAALKQYADAAAPLYQSLDDAQKRRFGFLTRFMQQQRPMKFARNEERGRFEQRGPDRFERGHHRRFGAADGADDNRFAANPGAGPERSGRADRDDD